MASLLNRARMSTSTTGTGTVTLGSAVTGYASFAEAGAVNGTSYSYCIEDGNDFEIGTGTYTSAGTTFSRDAVTLSKISGTSGTSKINLSGSAEIFITLRTQDLSYQPLDSELTALAGLTSAADQLPYFTGSGTAALTTLSSFARTILDDTTGIDVLGTLGVGINFGTITDDSVSDVDIGATFGAFLLINTTAANVTKPSLFWIRATTSPECSLIVQHPTAAGDTWGMTTSSLSGTTGTDGVCTLASLSNGHLQVENRQGFSVSARAFLFKVQ